MNAPTPLLSLFAALLPLAGIASPSQAPPALLLDCARPALPNQRAIAEFAGVASFSQTYALRERLMQDVRRACKRGAGQVRLVRESRAGSEPAVAVATIRP